MSERRPGGLRLTDADMAQCLRLAIGGGEAVVYSARAPGKDGPNEDTAALVPVDASRCVLVVADGLGGQPGGADAADIAVRCVEAAVAVAAGAGESLRGELLDAVEEANRQVRALGVGAATTLAMVEIDGATLRAYHVGDSEVLLVGQRGRRKLETIAHSPVGYAVEAGVLDPEAALHHRERHLISNVVGAEDMRIEVGSPVAVARRDTLLLATDGLFDNLLRREIVDIVRTKPLPVVADILAQTCALRMRSPQAGEPSKPDDLTFVVWRPGTRHAAKGREARA